MHIIIIIIIIKGKKYKRNDICDKPCMLREDNKYANMKILHSGGSKENGLKGGNVSMSQSEIFFILLVKSYIF